VDLIFSGKLAPVDIATFSCFNQDFSTIFRTSPLLFSCDDVITKNFSAFCAREKSTFTFSKSTCQLFFSVEIPSWMGLSGPQLAAVPGLWVGIPQWMGFSRPQLVVVSGLFWWESLDGWDFLGHNLLLSQTSLVGIPS
jgi:hypothetical protein